MYHDELLDIVDEFDVVIGQEWRSVIYERNLPFRVVNAFLFNSKKQLWIPRRHANKRLFPLALDCSVGGHVLAGETYDQALLRETQEELSIALAPESYQKVVRLTPAQHGTSSFMWVYLFHSDQVPDYNKNDFSEYYWLSLPELIARIESGDQCKSDLLPIARAINGLI